MADRKFSAVLSLEQPFSHPESGEYQNRLLEELMLKEYSIYLECLSWVMRNIGHLIEQKIVSHLFREKDYMS